MKRKIKENLPVIERVVYIILIVGLVIYGLKETDAAVKLIDSVYKAFSLLISNQ